MLVEGARLGGYEVLGPLGAGGMGEVYRARDTRLGRDVALKVLPDDVAHDPERRRRFEREARVLAALNHPAIAALFGIEEADGALCLVMELVEGPTLAERLRPGPLRLSEALGLARQVADALEAAHERGILHRDLKPQNIKITPEGRVKLLDFGLAKVLQAEDSGAAASEKPTAAADTTGLGVAVGTAPYMSPEQARGEAVDRRTDVWAFGCVLYEMVSGRRAFPGPSRSEAIAAVLEREPNWEALPDKTPAKVRDVLGRCLQKDSRDRLHDIADARIELEEALDETSSGAGLPPPDTGRSRSGGRRVTLIIFGLAAAILGSLLTWALLRPQLSRSQLPTRLTIPLPAGVRLPGVNAPSPLALSPRGSALVFVGVSARGSQLYVHALGSLDSKPIPETQGAVCPFFSPDGRWIGFAQGGQVKKIRIEGGPPTPICDAPQLRGASWGPDDTIVFTPRPWSGLWRVSAGGGAPRPFTTVEEQRDSDHRWPQILPSGRGVVFTLQPNSLRLDDARVGVASLDTGKWRVVLEGGAYGRYIASGLLVYARNGALLAVPFDPSRLEVTGPAVPVLEDVEMDPLGMSVAHLEVSRAGSLAYVPGYPRPVDRSLLWVDRQGRTQPVTEARHSYLETALSPDGRRLAVRRREGTTTNLWLLDLARDTWTRLTSGKDDRNPVWSPDGRRLAFSSNREGAFNLYWMPADGSGAPERLTRSPQLQTPSGWSPDGRLLAFNQQGSESWQDIWVLPLEGERQPRPLLVAPTSESSAVFSPDGRWIAYQSSESGRSEVYVRPFPGLGAKYQVSHAGGLEPRWSRDGRQIFWRGGKVMSVAVALEPTVRVGTPKPLFDDSFGAWLPYSRNYDVSPDEQRFLMIEQPEDVLPPNRIVVIPDFEGEVKAKLRAAQP